MNKIYTRAMRIAVLLACLANSAFAEQIVAVYVKIVSGSSPLEFSLKCKKMERCFERNGALAIAILPMRNIINISIKDEKRKLEFLNERSSVSLRYGRDIRILPVFDANSPGFTSAGNNSAVMYLEVVMSE